MQASFRQNDRFVGDCLDLLSKFLDSVLTLLERLVELLVDEDVVLV